MDNIRTCKEMIDLINLLEKNHIPFQLHIQDFSFMEPVGFLYPMVVVTDKKGKVVADAIWHPGSYGFQSELLETMPGSPDCWEEGVEGWCSAEEAYANLTRAYYLACKAS